MSYILSDRQMFYTAKKRSFFGQGNPFNQGRIARKDHTQNKNPEWSNSSRWSIKLVARKDASSWSSIMMNTRDNSWKSSHQINDWLFRHCLFPKRINTLYRQKDDLKIKVSLSLFSFTYYCRDRNKKKRQKETKIRKAEIFEYCSFSLLDPNT